MNCKRLTYSFGVAVCGSAMLGTPLSAQNNSTLGATAQVDGSCTIAANDLNFNILDTQTVTQVDASATVTVECTTFTVFEVSMGPGYHENLGQRRMSNG
ncbi:MAG: spore coat protein U domain-containing protein, partial [Erythrobacter sp.]